MLNKEVVSLESVVKSDSQVLNKKCILFEGSQEKSQASIKGRQFEDYIASREALWCTLFEERIVEDCWEGVPHWLIKGRIKGYIDLR